MVTLTTKTLSPLHAQPHSCAHVCKFQKIIVLAKSQRNLLETKGHHLFLLFMLGVFLTSVSLSEDSSLSDAINLRMFGPSQLLSYNSSCPAIFIYCKFKSACTLYSNLFFLLTFLLCTPLVISTKMYFNQSVIFLPIQSPGF